MGRKTDSRFDFFDGGLQLIDEPRGEGAGPMGEEALLGVKPREKTKERSDIFMDLSDRGMRLKGRKAKGMDRGI